MKNFNRNYSLIAFFNEDWNILFQNRKSISKIWEEYWFFGWWVEAWETFEEALIREIKEELNIDLKLDDLNFACSFTKLINWLWTSSTNIYVVKFNFNHEKQLEVFEWDWWEWLTLFEFSNKKILPHDYLIIDMLKKYFEKL